MLEQETGRHRTLTQMSLSLNLTALRTCHVQAGRNGAHYNFVLARHQRLCPTIGMELPKSLKEELLAPVLILVSELEKARKR